MSEITGLYQDLIIDHSTRPRNFKRLEPAQSAEGYNPLCGDRVTVYVRMEGDRVADAGFQGEGCAISKASASLMTESIKGRTHREIEDMFSSFRALVTGAADPDGRLGKLAVFEGLRDFPTRVKCGTLAWHALCAALENAGPL